MFHYTNLAFPRLAEGIKVTCEGTKEKTSRRPPRDQSKSRAENDSQSPEGLPDPTTPPAPSHAPAVSRQRLETADGSLHLESWSRRPISQPPQLGPHSTGTSAQLLLVLSSDHLGGQVTREVTSPGKSVVNYRGLILSPSLTQVT